MRCLKSNYSIKNISVEKAFDPSITQNDASVDITFKIADGYYLYKEKFATQGEINSVRMNIVRPFPKIELTEEETGIRSISIL